ncbi:MAG: hypothetical protein K0U78_21215 [Actinomycetia bacterium]|nr:hypothetical protein [Actinomycetes bacterium]
MSAVTPSSSADQVKCDVAALPASGAAIEAAATSVAATTGAAAGQSAATTAAGAGPDGVSTAITAAMAGWPAERAILVAKTAALAEHTASTDRAGAAELEGQDAQNAASIAAASPGSATYTQPASYNPPKQGPHWLEDGWELDEWGVPVPILQTPGNPVPGAEPGPGAAASGLTV